MLRIPFYILDVFSNRPNAGNQLAVFHDPEDLLDGHTMQLLAREINFAESSFIKEQLDETTFRVRIYTPECEVPFAGHPSLGTAAILREHVLPNPIDTIQLQLKAGLVPLTFTGGKGFMTQIQPTIGKEYDKEEISDLFLTSSDSLDSLPIQELSTGLPYILVPLKSKEALAQIDPEAKTVIQFLKRHNRHISNSKTGQSTAFYFFCKGEGEEDFQGRMFCLEQGKIIEDAATGSANGCFLAYLLTHLYPEVKCTVKQGMEMGRPSFLYLEGNREESHYTLKVGGESVLIAEGFWRVELDK